MESLEEMLSWIDSSEQEIIDAMIGMASIPALAPVNGGNGESAKADYVMGLLKGFDTVERVDVPDDLDPTVMRSNIVCRRNGRSKGTVWTVSHLDVVPAGDPELWDNPPFEPVYRDGRVYGRGTEDNGQSVISTIFASRCFAGKELNGMSLGVVFVADEETGSEKGICQLIERGFFSADDVIIVPDWGSPNGSMVEVMEKSILWLRFRIKGKTTHASSPDEGINAYCVSTRLLSDLMDGFEERFGERDPLFIPDRSTFEPTKRPATVENVNTIPGYDEFCMDIRLLPCHRMEDVMAFIEEVMEKHRHLSGADISVEKLQSNESYGPSSMESAGHAALLDSIEHVTGSRPRDVAVGGGTCANFFRKAGYDAYVWQCGGGTLHAPNEYVVIEDLKKDAKVFVGLFHRLCL